MGIVQRQQEEALARGWTAPNKQACEQCVKDPFLRDLVRAHLTSRKCSYCGASGATPIASDIATIIEPIVETVRHYFMPLDECELPLTFPGLSSDTVHTDEVLNELELNTVEKLFGDIVAAIDDESWVPAMDGNPCCLDISDSLWTMWAAFAEHVKHRIRYFFNEQTHGVRPFPAALLERLAGLVTQCDLVTSLRVGTQLFRARVQKALGPLDAQQFGPPPAQRARAGRMNPAGISYLYCSREEDTAVQEVHARDSACTLAVGTFVTKKELTVLNLAQLPPCPSPFDREKRDLHDELLFLTSFVKDICRPVLPDRDEHIEYVPSQIVCEYFATMADRNEGPKLHGMIYPSAVRKGGDNVVLFPPRANDDRWYESLLDFQPSASHAVTPAGAPLP